MTSELIESLMCEVDRIKDDYRHFPDGRILRAIPSYLSRAGKDSTNNSGLDFLVLNAVRKYRGLSYPQLEA